MMEKLTKKYQKELQDIKEVYDAAISIDTNITKLLDYKIKTLETIITDLETIEEEKKGEKKVVNTDGFKIQINKDKVKYITQDKGSTYVVFDDGNGVSVESLNFI